MKLLKSINSIKKKTTSTLETERQKLIAIIQKKQEQIKTPPPRQTTQTLSAIITSAKDAYSKMKTIFNPSTNRGGRGGGKRNTVKHYHKIQNNRRSNRRIRKFGVLTRKRRNTITYEGKPSRVIHQRRSCANTRRRAN